MHPYGSNTKTTQQQKKHDLCLQQIRFAHAPSRIYEKQLVVSSGAVAHLCHDVMQLVVGLFQSMEGAQQLPWTGIVQPPAAAHYDNGQQQRTAAQAFAVIHLLVHLL